MPSSKAFSSGKTKQRHNSASKATEGKSNLRNGSKPTEMKAVPAAKEVSPSKGSSQDTRLEMNPVNQDDGEGDGSSVLRWKLNKLENDKLDLLSKCNQEVSRYESQQAKLHAELERGEAQRQNLEYELAVWRRDMASERSKRDALHARSQQLEVQSVGLQQQVTDLEKALAITRHAREEDQRALRSELGERDQLLQLTAEERDMLRTEKEHLEVLLQEQKATLQELQRKLEQSELQHQHDSQSLRKRSGELQKASAKEQRLQKEMQSFQQKLRELEAGVESERAAHLESKFNSELLQLRIHDLEAALQEEKSSHAEALSSVELSKLKFLEVEKVYKKELAEVGDVQDKLERMQEDFKAIRAQLCTEQQEKEKVKAELMGKVEECDRLQNDTLQQLHQAVQQLTELQEEHKECERALEKMLQHYRVAGSPGSSGRQGLLRLLDTVKATLREYKESHDRSNAEVLRLEQECAGAREECVIQQEAFKSLKEKLQESYVRLTQLGDECGEATAQVARAQVEVCSTQSDLEMQRRRADEAERVIEQLTTEHQSDSQEKLAFLHDLYQRLVAGCVLMTPPQGLLGSFSWPELCTVLQEHTNSLTSDLHLANEKVTQLQHVCEQRNVALRELQHNQRCGYRKMSDLIKTREDAWQKERREIERRYGEAQARVEHWQQVVQKVQSNSSSLENTQTHTCLQLQRARQESGALLAICSLLVGALLPLMAQKEWLQGRLRSLESFRAEVSSLEAALQPEGGSEAGPRQRCGLRKFQRCALALRALSRMRKLGSRSTLLFTLDLGGAGSPLYVRTPGTAGDGQRDSRAQRWLCSEKLLSLMLSSTAPLQESLTTCTGSQPTAHQCADSLLHEARCCFSSLMQRLVSDPALACSAWHCEREGHRPQIILDHAVSKQLVSALQRHILEFTHRLHSAEVERRSLRIELVHLRHGVKKAEVRAEPGQQTAVQFETVCQELSDALQREQQAQTLLHQQAQQLQDLTQRLEQHSLEEADKNETLADAVQSLSQSRQDLRMKDQCLRQLGRQLSQLRQSKRQLEEKVRASESALCQAARNKDALMTYMWMVEDCVREVKERISHSETELTSDVFTLHLPIRRGMMGADALGEGPENFISSFLELHQLSCSRMALLEKEISSHKDHMAALKAELSDAHQHGDHSHLTVSAPPTALSEDKRTGILKNKVPRRSKTAAKHK